MTNKPKEQGTSKTYKLTKSGKFWIDDEYEYNRVGEKRYKDRTVREVMNEEQERKRKKKESNARYRAKRKAGGGGGDIHTGLKGSRNDPFRFTRPRKTL
tara:strand:- start:13 stop:309 length:297 start_codon:yes stop_codon:yes gene_type:complete